MSKKREVCVLRSGQLGGDAIDATSGSGLDCDCHDHAFRRYAQRQVEMRRGEWISENAIVTDEPMEGIIRVSGATRPALTTDDTVGNVGINSYSSGVRRDYFKGNHVRRVNLKKVRERVGRFNEVGGIKITKL